MLLAKQQEYTLMRDSIIANLWTLKRYLANAPEDSVVRREGEPTEMVASLIKQIEETPAFEPLPEEFTKILNRLNPANFRCVGD